MQELGHRNSDILLIKISSSDGGFYEVISASLTPCDGGSLVFDDRDEQKRLKYYYRFRISFLLD